MIWPGTACDGSVPIATVGGDLVIFQRFDVVTFIKASGFVDSLITERQTSPTAAAAAAFVLLHTASHTCGRIGFLSV